jgi:hypothetical protein
MANLPGGNPGGHPEASHQLEVALKPPALLKTLPAKIFTSDAGTENIAN